MRVHRGNRGRTGTLMVFVTCCVVLALGAVTPAGSGTTRSLQENDRALRPGQEHLLLERDVGVWDATIQVAVEPGAPPEITNGVETNTLAAGGLWLISEFKTRLLGQPFEGRGILGYDLTKRKYVRIWVDSTQPYFWPAEGDYDPETDTLTLWMAATDTEGETVRWRAETVWKDQDTRTFTMYLPGGEATEAAAMKIIYKRRK